MSGAKQTMKKGEHSSHLINIDAADEKITAMVDKIDNPTIIERAKVILRKILTKNARVYEFDKASAGLHAVSVYLACEEHKLAGHPGRKLTQKECQQQSDLGPKLFRRSVDLCRQAKDLNESQITFAYLVRKYGGDMALQFMDAIYKHFKKSCFDAGIVNDMTWDANHILVVCAVYCWTCDHVYPYPKYKGPDVAFHCGLGWENVQKSMFYNLNPHCTERMRELLDAYRATQSTASLVNRPPYAAQPTITVPRPTVPPSSSSSPNPIAPYPSHASDSRTSLPNSTSASSNNPDAVKQEPSSSYSPWHTINDSNIPWRVNDVSNPPSAAPTPSTKPSASTSASGTPTTSVAPATPIAIDLTLTDDDESVQTGASGRSRRKNAGKRRIDGEEVGQPNPKRSSKRQARNDDLDSDDFWQSRPDDEIFMKNPDETNADTELRVYYAWKRMMTQPAGKGLAFTENAIRDFVIT